MSNWETAIISGLVSLVGVMIKEVIKQSQIEPIKRAIEILGPYSEENNSKAKVLLKDLEFIAEMKKRYNS